MLKRSEELWIISWRFYQHYLTGRKQHYSFFVVTLVCSIPLGAVVAVGNISKIAPLKFILNIYIWIMRGTPLLLQLIFIYYGLPIIGVVF